MCSVKTRSAEKAEIAQPYPSCTNRRFSPLSDSRQAVPESRTDVCKKASSTSVPVGWETTISTQYGDVGLKATTDAAEGFDVFTYEITNLSHRPEGPGIGALGISLPIAAMAITSPSGWKTSPAIGTLGGFLAYSSKDGMGIAVGETSRVSFSLPTPPASAPSQDGPKTRYPPGLLLSGPAELAVGVIHLHDETNSDIPRPWDFRHWREIEWEDLRFLSPRSLHSGDGRARPGQGVIRVRSERARGLPRPARR